MTRNINSRKIKLCIAITASSHLWSLHRGQLQYLMNQGYSITCISSPGPEHDWLSDIGVNIKSVSMSRQPNLIKDILSLLRLIWFFMFNRFDIVSFSSPKASLLVGLASYVTFQSKKVFIVRGRVYENYKGKKLFFFRAIDKTLCFIANSVFAISQELKNNLINENICAESKVVTIGSGSSNGVDTEKFSLNKHSVKERESIRNSLGILENDIVLLYSGRIRKEKGINELISAYAKLEENRRNTHLLLQGKFELFDLLEPNTLDYIQKSSTIHILDWSDNHEFFYASADLFVFPSYREGFGNALLEAAAMGLPSIAFDVIGCREAIENNVTGLLCSPRDYEALYAGIETLLDSPELMTSMGYNARKRVENHFQQINFWVNLDNMYRTLISTEKMK